MKRIVVLIVLITAAFSPAIAQKHLFGIGWVINIPSNNEYLTETSFTGGKFDYRYFVKSNFSVGIAFDWATYEQYLSRQTFEKPDGNSAVTSDFVAQAYQVPIVATAHFYFMESKMLKPFAGLGLGAQYLEQSLYYNVYVSDDNNWGFVVRPEIGTLIKLNETWGVLVGAHYSMGTNKTELLNRDSFKNFGFSIGLAFLGD